MTSEVNKDVRLAVTLPPYRLGDPVEFTQELNVPINLFALRKDLEQYQFHELMLKIYRLENRNLYTLGIDISRMNVQTTDQFFKIVSEKLGVENNQQAISDKIHSIMKRHYTNDYL